MILWNQLRKENLNSDFSIALQSINDWWQLLPIDLHYLHINDINKWPDPWELLADGIFCEIAKSLGIVYTLYLLERSDISDLEIIITDENNTLVMVNEKYILNWAPGEVLNIESAQIKVKEKINTLVLKKKIN